MFLHISRLGLYVIAGTALSGCSTMPKSEMTPAALVQTDRASMSAVETAAAKVLGKTSIALGASDLLNSSSISIIPKRLAPVPGAPFSQNDFAVPTMLTLMTDGTNCYLVKDGTDDVVQIESLNCRPLE